ncbi:MAG: LptF/LptG family permease [Chitinophagales bacterium]|nr:LptF/LptG family permease [Chitinophagales bacterium]
MKKIDKLLLTSSVGPFAVAFFIAVFVLVIQIMWLYIDEIAGKGVSFFIMLELVGYMSVTVFPMALPIAVLIASVMVMGGLAERYELSSMKSAGVPLIRVMRTLIIMSAGIALFSYVCSDYLIPIANLKFRTRLFDIRKAKPALTMEKGVFNEDFRQFVIRLGDKLPDGETIRDVMIEDQSNLGQVKFNQILADSGQMYTTADKRFFVMNLYDGMQYQEPGNQGPNSNQRKFPFIRTQFKSWSKVWDMREFELVRTDEDRLSKQRTFLSMSELRSNMDSLAVKIKDAGQLAVSDMLINVKRKPTPPIPQIDTSKRVDARTREGLRVTEELRRANKAANSGPNLPVQELNKPLTQYSSLLETFRDRDKSTLMKEAKTRHGLARNIVETRKNQVIARRLEWVKTGYELYNKYSFALVCFIFLFVGAPMGAIIRKGGFGYPILVSIIFFVTFVFLAILCRKLAEAYIMSPFWAAMTPCGILALIGIYVTRKAMNDSQLFSMEPLERLINRIRKWTSLKKLEAA